MSVKQLSRYDSCSYNEHDFDADIAFASDVQKNLGYKINAQNIVTENTDALLLSTLSKLEIRPFTIESVNKYKEYERERRQVKRNHLRFLWKKTNLKDYRGPVPEFALQTALDIRKHCPFAEFFIDELVSENIPTNDPFLLVKPDFHSFKEYYLEVWNEPRYRQERMA